jgi:anti-sigma B factor antagonist
MTVMPLKRRASFRIAVTPDEDRVLVAPAGELDLSTALPLEEEIKRLQADGGFQSLVLDLRGLTFLDSSGLRLLVNARREAIEAGTMFSLIDGAPRVCRVLDITGLRSHFEFEPAPA